MSSTITGSGSRFNGDYVLDAGSTKFVYDLSDDSRIIIIGDVYYEEHGEPGGLRRRGDPAGDPVIRNWVDCGKTAVLRG